jgi:beta-lactamase regulating signal transducer with metallopeptidase domain
MAMTELLLGVLRANLIAALAILAVLAVRLPFRRVFGAETAYVLWLAPPIAVAAGFLPARVTLAAPSVVEQVAQARSAVVPDWASAALLCLWLLGAAAMALRFHVAHRRFLRQVARGGPEAAVVGFINPKVLMPRDDGRFTVAERALMRAHEQEHIARGDPLANLWIAIFQCAAWFNPLAHAAAHMAKLDQELACDAAILRRDRRARGLYAKTLLKAQLAGQAPPLVSAWAAGGKHPLEVRVGALRQLGVDDAATGPVLVLLTIMTLAAAAWYAEPPELRAFRLMPRVTIEEPTMTVLLVRDHKGGWKAGEH